MGFIKDLLHEERERSDKLRRQCRSQESLISRIPYEQREKLIASMEKQKERGQER